MNAPRLVDAAILLLRALRSSAAAAACPIEIVAHRDDPWASATFVGARHLVELTALACPALDAWLEALPGMELAVRGHVIVDLAIDGVVVDGDRTLVTLAALTLAEA